MAIAVSLSCVTIGAILSTAVLIGPAAAALRLTKRPGLAFVWAGLIGLGVTWVGILLAYDSYFWPPIGRGWPVSFFVVALILVIYLLADLSARRSSKRPSASALGAG
jgi:zinc/manganese transport system permease protein